MSLSEVGRARIFLLDAVSLILNRTMSWNERGLVGIISIAALQLKIPVLYHRKGWKERRVMTQAGC